MYNYAGMEFSSVTALAEYFNLNPKTVYTRLQSGKTLHEAITMPFAQGRESGHRKKKTKYSSQFPISVTLNGVETDVYSVYELAKTLDTRPSYIYRQLSGGSFTICDAVALIRPKAIVRPLTSVSTSNHLFNKVLTVEADISKVSPNQKRIAELWR